MSASTSPFWVTLAVIAWIIAGYPCWLALRSAVASRPVRERDWEPAVTAVIPVYNGEAFLQAKISSVLAMDYPSEKLEILVLSDGSTDDSDAIAAGFEASGRVRLCRLPKGGKAAALNAAWPEVSREVVLLTDVRQVLDPACLRSLVRRLHDPSVGVVSGSLRIRAGDTAGESSVGLYWRYENWIRRNLGRVESILGATGPIYVIRRSLVKPLPSGCILDDMWLPLQAVLAGSRAVLAPDAIAWDYPTGLASEFRRKVRTQAGVWQLMWQEPRLLMPWRNRLFVPFVTLKLGRLLLGHMLLLLLVSAFWLPAPLRAVTLAVQAVFYGVWLLDRFLPERGPLARLTAPVAAAITLVAAAFCGQAIFFRDPATLWRTTTVRMKHSTGSAERVGRP